MVRKESFVSLTFQALNLEKKAKRNNKQAKTVMVQL